MYNILPVNLSITFKDLPAFSETPSKRRGRNAAHFLDAVYVPVTWLVHFSNFGRNEGMENPHVVGV